MDPDRNITCDLIARAESHPNDAALIFHDRQIGYRALDRQVWRVSNFLKRNGIRSGDVVGVSTRSDLNTILLMLGIARIGATVFSLPKSSNADQHQEMISESGTSRIVCDHRWPVGGGLPVLGFERKLLKSSDSSDFAIDSRPEHPWIIISGSGSTGKPKMIPVTHRTQRTRSAMSREWLGLTPDDRVASLSHFDFTHPKNRLLEALWSGASYVVDSANLGKPVELSRRHRLTVPHATVFHVQRLLDSAGSDTTGMLPSLRALCLSASTVNPPLRSRIGKHLTRNLVVRYASNETGPISFAKYPDVFESSETVGKPIEGVRLSILDRKMRPVAPGTEGMIAVDSPGNFDGYLNDPAADETRFTEHGFLPGDVARLDHQGRLVFLGRADQMMIFNGVNIYPAEIERVLAAHPAVSDAVCFSVPHAVHQDVPRAVVSLKPGLVATELELRDYCRERLGFRSPGRVLIVNVLPRNERGKIVRAELMDLMRRSNPNVANPVER